MAHILVIDDDEPICELLQKMLEDSGHKVSIALNGESALGIHRDNPADLIITDLIMPVKSGIDTIKEFRKSSPNIKIIAITGKDPDYLKYADFFGADCCFEKPFHKKEILKAVGKLIGIQKAIE